jgi:hypothetical protein
MHGWQSTFFRGIVLIIASGLLAFFGGSIAYEIVHGSMGYDVVAWIYGAFVFLIGFLFACAGGRRRYVWIAAMMTPIFLILLLILTSSFRDTGSFSSDDITDFILLFLFGGILFAPSIGLGVFARHALARVVSPSVWNQL